MHLIDLNSISIITDAMRRHLVHALAIPIGMTFQVTFVAVPAYYAASGGVYAARCVYAPDAAFTHTCLYAGVGVYTQVRAYTHPRVRIRG